MNIGILKERKVDENRVALTPALVQSLVGQGHTIYVEQKAGDRSGFSDAEYERAGALVSRKQTLLEHCKFLLKVKCPLESEFNDYKRDHILFTYFHLDENIPKHKIQKLIKTGALGISYE